MCVELASVTDNTDDVEESSGFTTQKLSVASGRLFSRAVKGVKIKSCVQMCAELACTAKCFAVHV